MHSATTKNTFCALLFILMPIVRANAQTSVDEVLKTAVNRYATDLRASNDYAYVQKTSSKNFNKDGKMTFAHTYTFEAILVEGIPYLRKTEEDGHPLSGKKAQDEEKKYFKAVEERKGMSEAQKLASLMHKTATFHMPIEYLPDLFQCSAAVAGQKTDDERVMHIACTPKENLHTAKPEEMNALRMCVEAWIDLTANSFTKMTAILNEPVGNLLKGTTATYTWQQHDSHYLLSKSVFTGLAKVYFRTLRFESSDEYDQYQKFSASAEPEK